MVGDDETAAPCSQPLMDSYLSSISLCLCMPAGAWWWCVEMRSKSHNRPHESCMSLVLLAGWDNFLLVIVSPPPPPPPPCHTTHHFGNWFSSLISLLWTNPFCVEEKVGYVLPIYFHWWKCYSVPCFARSSRWANKCGREKVSEGEWGKF